MTMLPLVEKLVQALESEGVVYCHWKSNAFVADAARGVDDLDLLISPASRQVFLAVLQRLGFKEACIKKRADRIPGILDYYGYDKTASRLIHVHAHYKLVLGQDMTKNYHLPVENAYLESASPGEFFPLPAPEFEWCVFVVRMMLKHSTWNAILGRLGKLCDRERQEMEYLQKSVTRERTARVLSAHLPILSLGLFDDCVRSLQPGCPFWTRVRAGERLQKALRGCRRLPKGMDIWLQFWRRLKMAVRRRLPGQPPGKRIKNGGMLVAVVGGDGAGKTTVIEGILEWLSAVFVTKKVHLGKPPWSPLSTLVRGKLKVGRTLGFYPFTRADGGFHDEKNPGPFPGYPTLIREICTARDRYISYVKARKQADKGVFVICDRFPLPGRILTDGPQIEWMAKAFPDKRFLGFLGRLEGRYYRSILRPDLLLVLKVDPETAVVRKTDEDAESVRARSKEFWEKDWEGTAVQTIDAKQRKEDVLNRAKDIFWAHI
jgi:thymidylate kinase